METRYGNSIGPLRNELVDFVRGLALLDMMLVHYSPWLEWPSFAGAAKLIRYSDFAVEAFVVLAGFVVGGRYLEVFVIDSKPVVRKLMHRLAGIIAIHYVMILTLSIPVAVAVGSQLTKADDLGEFTVKSFLFLNQVPLLHILPTFIPLFAMAIPLLYLLKYGQDYLVGIGSIALFAVGNWAPYWGAELWGGAIFPAILWQVYFVTGVLIGKHQRVVAAMFRQYGVIALTIAAALLTAMMAVYHGHHLFPSLGEIQARTGWIVKKFPLNYLGLLYHGSILFLVVTASAVGWQWLKIHPLISDSMGSLGRNSLAVFIAHVYVCFLTTYLLGKMQAVVLFVMVLNIAGSFLLSGLLDGKSSRLLHLGVRRT